MRELIFAIRVLLETRLAPVLLLWRRLVAGYPYRLIPLTQGRFARVDPQDYPALARHKWCAAKQGNSFYAVRSEGGRQLRMHREIMSAPPGRVVDHINHCGLHNVRRNLRTCTQSENARNQQAQTGCSSKFIGVAWHKGERRWCARIHHHGRRHWLGLFKSERQAARARDDAALALHGEYANLNFPRRYRRLRLLARLRQRLAALLWTDLKPPPAPGPPGSRQEISHTEPRRHKGVN